MKETQLELLLDFQIKIQPEASNDAVSSLIPSMIREAVADSPVSFRSAPFEPHMDTANDPSYQEDIEFGRLYLKTPAPNGRWIDNKLKLDASGSLVIHRLMPELEQWKDAQRFHAAKYWSALEVLLANLLDSYERSQQLLISFKTAHKSVIHGLRQVTNNRVAECVRFLESGDYIQVVSGRNNQFDGISSWCTPRSKLIALFDQTQASVRLAEGSPLAVVRERPKKSYGAYGKVHKETGAVINFPLYSREHNRLRLAGEVLISYTETWCHHTATLHGRYVTPWLERIFIEKTTLGGRFYGEYQNLPKSERNQILIDGERTVELDFKSLHYAMMYAKAGLQLEDDPYSVEGFSRQTIKLVSLILANTSHLHVLKGQITQSGNPENQKLYPILKQKLAIYNEYRKRGLVCGKPYIPNWYESFIEGVPAGMTGEELICAIQKRHPAIADQFGQADIGLKLQYLDSQIMTHTLGHLANVPILPVHDSIRCRASDKARVRAAMLRAGRVVLGVDLVISD
ncbi:MULTISPECIES: hypothetical protein [unclassified Marinobacterium]|uniref:hypothetical protein n=1 Tax=unclassified Marinobacterium TaxID=2644139 RepID=UPI0015681996|nr:MULTISPECIES: hypothetical protein [unclassified Marinobacterium]NRP53652.1 hypothetical protein [Marinobacterium sp. xm-v-242]NRP78150.1 hypothetical protein [Marinobacterium sp. xm-m-383]